MAFSPGMSLHVVFVSGFQVPTPPTFSHVLDISPAGNSPLSQYKFTTESIEKGDVRPLTSTLPLEGATGGPQVTSKEGGKYSNSHESDLLNLRDSYMWWSQVTIIHYSHVDGTVCPSQVKLSVDPTSAGGGGAPLIVTLFAGVGLEGQVTAACRK